MLRDQFCHSEPQSGEESLLFPKTNSGNQSRNRLRSPNSGTPVGSGPGSRW